MRRWFLVVALLLLVTGIAMPGPGDAVWQSVPMLMHFHSLHSLPDGAMATSKKTFLPGEYDHVLSEEPGNFAQRILRDRLPIRVMGTADHGEALDTNEWLRQGNLSARYNQSELVFLRGFEWTLGGMTLRDTTPVDHIAVYGSDRYAGTKAHVASWQGDTCPNLSTFYTWLAEQPGDIFAAFCHPWEGNSHFGSFGLPEIAGLQTVHHRLALLEVGGGQTHQFDLREGERWYQQALLNGWNVAPCYGIDNFAVPKKDFLSRAGSQLLLPANAPLTTQSALDAVLKRRVYARTEPWRLDTWQYIDRFSSGETAKVASGQWLAFTVQLSVPTGRVERKPKLRMVQIHIPSCSLLVWSLANSTHTVKDGRSVFVWLGVETAYGLDPQPRYLALEEAGRVVLVSAPIWLSGDPHTTPLPKRYRFPIETVRPIHSIAVEPWGMVQLRFAQDAGLSQALRLSVDGQPVSLDYYQPGQKNFCAPLTWHNQKGISQRIDIECFAMVNADDIRPSKLRLKDHGKTICFEDGDDDDYNDLVIEVKGVSD